jgi:hypothetical protein
MECSKCLYWVKQEEDAENQADCRRYPPTAFLGQRLNPLSQGFNFTITTVYPKVKGHLWCGEFIDKGNIKQ